MVKKSIYLLPNLFTLAGLFAGFYGIVAAMKGFYSTAAIAIFVAMIMDSLDGRVARMTQTQSEFGADLDSLSDMVCFGIAPALIVYSWGLYSIGKLGWLSAFIFAVAVALRLARFNSQKDTSGEHSRYFQGLACPAGAANIVALVWCADRYDVPNDQFSIAIAIAVFTVCIGGLMVSPILYRSFKDFDLKKHVPFMVILAVVLVFVLVSLDPPSVLFLTFLGYALYGPIVALWQLCRRPRRFVRIKKKHG